MWFIAILVGLAVLIIFVTCVPLDAALKIDTSARPKFRVRLVWLFGLVSKELSREKTKPEEKKEIIKEKPKKKKGIEFRTVLRILRTKGLLRKTKGLVRDVVCQVKTRELAVNCRLGLDDPADTALLFALVEATRPFVNLPSQYQIRVQPSFADEAVFYGNLHGVARLQPIGLVWPVLRFVFSLAAFRVVKALVLSKWKRKK